MLCILGQSRPSVENLLQFRKKGQTMVISLKSIQAAHEQSQEKHYQEKCTHNYFDIKVEIDKFSFLTFPSGIVGSVAAKTASAMWLLLAPWLLFKAKIRIPWTLKL